MSSKAKQTISLILLIVSVLCLASGFLIVALYSYLIGAMISMFIAAIVCFIVAIIIYPRDLAEAERHNEQERINKPKNNQHPFLRKRRHKNASNKWNDNRDDEDLEFEEDEEDYEEFESVDKQ